MLCLPRVEENICWEFDRGKWCTMEASPPATWQAWDQNWSEQGKNKGFPSKTIAWIYTWKSVNFAFLPERPTKRQEFLHTWKTQVCFYIFMYLLCCLHPGPTMIRLRVQVAMVLEAQEYICETSPPSLPPRTKALLGAYENPWFPLIRHY